MPEYKSKGIGKELVKQMLKELDDIYMIDLCCDNDLVPYYEKLGMIKSTECSLEITKCSQEFQISKYKE